MFRIDFNKLRFLVCDDNPHMRRILRTLLHSFGAREVYESEDGATALEMYTHYVPDIVISDWAMPIFDGLELSQMRKRSLLKSMRNMVSPKGLPRVYHTGPWVIEVLPR
jgi:CheY-like chemotaxis protein